MPRADLLLELVRAGTRGEQPLFRKALEALIAEERAKQHHILADRLMGYLNQSEPSKPVSTPTYRNGLMTNLFFELNPTRRMDDLVLPDIVTAACKELIEEQNRSDILRSHNLEPRHRILFAGPPGNGKTSLAEALATELAVPLLVVRYESVIASYLGETAIRLSRLFEEVRTRRCVLFFDEFDVVGKERGDIHETGEIKRVVSSLLLQVDALPSYVIVVTATNHPELLDRAVWRRFQVRLELTAPTQKQTEEWLRRFESRIGEKFGVSANTLAKNLRGANFSELEQFGQDIQRRYVLSLPEANMQQIVKERLSQWKRRYSVTVDKQEDGNA
ncbi:AAA family ATPase [Syntrophorhabdus aromaticivorans]|jgi:SpoVK/Ycf46/Vps4 family AAA+-type ATPase|uniref:AAA family ATPase n=1 Tax=Syntrophorhabdus aromaticivorans TaxID=328301 RepID=UPI0003F56BF0|nr:ATP-binding protein [Syntrophorhabdus aromaticivorans]